MNDDASKCTGELKKNEFERNRCELGRVLGLGL